MSLIVRVAYTEDETTLDKHFSFSKREFEDFGKKYDVVWDREIGELTIIPARLTSMRYKKTDIVWTIRKESDECVIVESREEQQQKSLSLGESASFSKLLSLESGPVDLKLEVRFEKDD